MRTLPFLKSPPAKILTVLLLAQASLFYGLSRGEAPVGARQLDQFPSQAGAWRMIRENGLDQDVKETLRADDYLSRDYTNGERAIGLFVASFKSQRAGQTPHSPKNCLPGSGWVWSVADTIPVSIAGRKEPITVNRYIVSKGDEKAVVLYWFQSRGRVVAGEFRAAAFTAWDALRYNRTDTALVRVVVRGGPHGEAGALTGGVEFVRAIFPILRGMLPE
jgi:EpsI family protein